MVIKFPCVSCSKSVRSNQRGLKCTKCSEWVHAPCAGIDSKKYDNPDYEFVDWKCSKCLFSFLPLNVIEEENANCTDNPLLPVVNQINQNNIMTDTGSSYIKDSVNLKFDELNQKGLKLLHLNVRSLLRNISEIRLLLTQNDVHILSVNETWLDNSVLNNEIDIDDFQVIRKDRNRNGGGTAIYIKKRLTF